MKAEKKWLLLVLGGSVLLPSSVLAEGWYIGGGLGLSMSSSMSSQDYGNQLAKQGVNVQSVTLDERDMGFKLVQGYRFSQSLSLEANYTNLRTPISYTSVVMPNGTTRMDDTRIKGFGLDVIASTAINPNMSAFAKAGLFRARTSRFVNDENGSTERSTGDMTPKFGLGLDFRMNRSSLLRVEWERFQQVGDKNVTGEGGIDFWSANLIMDLSPGSKKRKRTAQRAAQPQAVAQEVAPTPMPAPRQEEEPVMMEDDSEIVLDSSNSLSMQGTYVGGYVSRGTIASTPVSVLNNAKLESSPVLVGGRVGVKISPYAAVEGRMATGITEDSIAINGFATPVETSADWYWGAFVKGMFPVAPQFSIYGLLGYAQLNTTVTGPGYKGEASDSGVSYGIGAEMGLSPKLNANVEWSRMAADGMDFDSLTAGVDYKL